MNEGLTMAMRPIRRTSVGTIHHTKPIFAKRRATVRLKNCESAPRMSMAARMYISPLTKLLGNKASTAPRMTLPNPTMGKGGAGGVSRLPWAS